MSDHAREEQMDVTEEEQVAKTEEEQMAETEEEQVAKTEEEQVAKTEEDEQKESTGKNETEYSDPNLRELPGTSKSFESQFRKKFKFEDDNKKNTDEETSKDSTSSRKIVPFLDEVQRYFTNDPETPTDGTTASEISLDFNSMEVASSDSNRQQESPPGLNYDEFMAAVNRDSSLYNIENIEDDTCESVVNETVEKYNEWCGPK